MRKTLLIAIFGLTLVLTGWASSRMVSQAQYISANEFWSADFEAILFMSIAGCPLCPASILAVLALIRWLGGSKKQSTRQPSSDSEEAIEHSDMRH